MILLNKEIWWNFLENLRRGPTVARSYSTYKYSLSDVQPEEGSQIEKNLIREPYWGLHNAYYLHPWKTNTCGAHARTQHKVDHGRTLPRHCTFNNILRKEAFSRRFQIYSYLVYLIHTLYIVISNLNKAIIW